MNKVNRYIEAFKENYNTIGLATVAAVSAALLTPVPLLAGLVAEAAYLLFVPDSKWYEARLARRFDAEVIARRQKLKDQTLPTLRPEMQERFLRLEEMRKQIDTQSQDDKAWFREVLRKLDYLLEKFLLFAAKEVQFRSYLQSLREEVRGERPRSAALDYDLRPPSTDRRAGRNMGEVRKRVLRPEPEERMETPSVDVNDRWTQKAVEEVQTHYAQEREHIEEMLAAEPDSDTKAVLEKRMDVLQRRNEFAGKIGKILTNINHQLQLVEDTFGLINDEIRARSPEQILADIEEVVIATDTMATTLEELAPLDQMIARIGV